MDIYEKCMFCLMVLYAFVSNFSTGATSVCIVLAALIVIVQKIRTGKLPLFDKKINQIIAIFLILQCVIAAFSINPGESFANVWGTAYRFIPLYMGLGYLKNGNQFAMIVVATVISALVNDMAGAYQFFVLGDVRARGMNGAATLYASQLLVVLPLIYMAVRDGSTKVKMISGTTLVATVGMLILSATRGGWLAFVFVILVLLLLEKRYRRKIFAVCMSLGIICGAFMLQTPYLQDRITSITDSQYATNKERLLMWQSATAIFMDYPLVGIGQDQFGFMYNTKYISPLAKERPVGDIGTGHGHPHNNFFKFLSEGGIVGIVAFFLLHGYFFYRMIILYRKEKDLPLCSYGMIGILMILGLHVEGMTDTNANQVPIMREYWFLMGLLLASAKIKLREDK